MVTRNILKTIKADLHKVPAVCILGPRQVGKTTLVKHFVNQNPKRFLYLDLESPADMNKLRDPELYFDKRLDKTIIIDEVQVYEDLFPILRSSIDKNRKPGRFILLGSASPALLKQSSESLAGRIRYRELTPFLSKEVSANKQEQLLIKGGFPAAFLSKKHIDSFDWLNDFLKTYISRDLPSIGLPMPASQIIRLLQMLAHNNGQILNYSQLAKSLQKSSPTLSNAIFYLEETFLIRRLLPWHYNSKKRLVKSPKIYFRDTGVLNYLLGIRDMENLIGHPALGQIWESFVIQNIVSMLPAGIEPYFYRTQDGAELDLVLAKNSKPYIGIEIKYSNTPNANRGNYVAKEDLALKKVYIITQEADNYLINKDIESISLSGFINIISKL